MYAEQYLHDIKRESLGTPSVSAAVGAMTDSNVQGSFEAGSLNPAETTAVVLAICAAGVIAQAVSKKRR